MVERLNLMTRSLISRRKFIKTVGFLTGSSFHWMGEKYASVFSDKSNAAYPSYLKLYDSGKLKQLADQLYALYECCELCPRDCRVNRTQKQLGKCQASATVKVSNAFPHYGEEAPLVGKRGSGTVFFSNCGLRCVYCQNYTISIDGEGVEIPDRRLAETMIKVQNMGCHNINLVTPTHYLPNIINALNLAVPMGLKIPLVYNTGGYEKADILKLLDGVVDIYMPDCKYMDPGNASKFSCEAYNYPYYVKGALKEMFRQVEDLTLDEWGIARRGLIIRHLVLPNRAAGTREFLQFVAEELSKTTYMNIMRQYRPEYKAKEHPEINRRITSKEYTEAVEWAKELGLTRLDRG